MDPAEVLKNLPPLKDLTTENITENVHLINSNCNDTRIKYILERLVVHLHDFARETRLSHEEWIAGLHFLTAVGQTCSDVRQEFILLSDVLGLSILVDSMSHPKPSFATEGTVLGPFHTHEAPTLDAHGGVISHDEGDKAVPMFVQGTVRNSEGKPIPDCLIDVWETDSTGHYDVQHKGYQVDGRAVIKSDSEGNFSFTGIVPVSYPIPNDGPVGQLLRLLKRHPYRPAHLHFMMAAPGYDRLITSLYLRGDPYESTDAVFGVKQSLVVDLEDLPAEQAAAAGIKSDTAKGAKLLKHDFVLVSEQEAKELREKKAIEALRALGRDKIKLVDGLPVPDVD